MSYLFAALFLFVATTFGSVLIVLWRKPISYTLALSFSGGVMLVASFLSLIVPAIEAGGFLLTSVGILLGFIFLGILENLFPHEHALKGYEVILQMQGLKKLYLITIGVAIHNVPEGLSVGIVSAHSPKEARDLAVAIGLQDIPEGLIVSLYVYSFNKSLFIPVLLGILSGLVEAVSTLLGYWTFEILRDFIAVGLGFGGGAMIYVTVKEVFPEVYAQPSEHFKATLGFLAGFMLMLFLDTL